MIMYKPLKTYHTNKPHMFAFKRWWYPSRIQQTCTSEGRASTASTDVLFSPARFNQWPKQEVFLFKQDSWLSVRSAVNLFKKFEHLIFGGTTKKSEKMSSKLLESNPVELTTGKFPKLYTLED